MKRHILFVVFSFLLTAANSQGKTDSVAIQKLLEKESATWRSGDIKGHADCWHIQPYSRILISLGDSTVLDIPPMVMINPPAGMMGKGGYSMNTNYKMSIGKTNAWVSHNEESVSKDGKRTYSYEIRILEKIKGQWKLVGQSIHVYKP
jgi:hypothetical protein